MYYNPQTQEMLSDQELKNLLNVSFPKNAESIEGWLYIHESVPEVEDGFSPVKDSIEVIDGQAIQTYKMEKLPSEESSKELTFEEVVQLRQKISMLEGCIAELAAMMSNLQVYCTNAVEKVKEAGK